MGVGVEVSLPLVVDVVLLDGVHQANIANLNKIVDFTLPGVLKSVLLHLIVILLCNLGHCARAILDYLIQFGLCKDGASVFLADGVFLFLSQVFVSEKYLLS